MAMRAPLRYGKLRTMPSFSLHRFALGLPALVLVLAACSTNGPDSDVMCFRAMDCVERCSGTVVTSGCSCPDGTFDDQVCKADAGTDATPPRDGAASAEASDGASD